jgi:hypothetical protein
METHLKVIAALYALMGLAFVGGAFFSQLILTLLAGLVGASDEEGAAVGAAVLGFAGVALTITLLAFAIPFLIGAWGLWTRRSWARVLGIILGILCLVIWPAGTLIAIYALVILFRKDTEALFTSSPTP